MYGELFGNFRNPDGTINSGKDYRQIVRMSGAAELPVGSLDDNNATAVTMFTDIPILSDSYVLAASAKLGMPTMQILGCLGNDKAKVFLNGLENHYSYPENEFWLIGTIFKHYQDGDLTRANQALVRVHPTGVKNLSEVPSICGRLYAIFFWDWSVIGTRLIRMWTWLTK